MASRLAPGLEVAASCDLRVASQRARFGMPEVKVGIPSVVEAALIPRLIGWGRARELLLLGETIDADTRCAGGWSSAWLRRTSSIGRWRRSSRRCLPPARTRCRIQKELIREWENLPAEQAIAAGIDAFVRAFDTDEPTRMLGAFSKRKR